ncbi:glycosyltransferase [Brevibacterium sp. BRM-1]|uniref:glycosyltransferase n=1 Tax=Brevibacterium sp. BRM-1 TaxID=2999062 RepID=UPI0022817581|nr:glycosyltransferase [Brevibacterium sp. BRM-1]WAL39409.1 glycosyltransferase [Brevibacterium sp. BRM-1]
MPSTHPYVDAAIEAAHVERVPLAPGVQDAPESAWRASPAFDPSWVAANAHRFDVCHVHFGFEGFTREQLSAFCAALRAHRKPLVLTVHDLDNPQLAAAEQEAFRERLGLLVVAAAEVLTLTPGAAAEIEARYGRRAIVVEHPPLGAPAGPGEPAQPEEPWGAGRRTGRTVGVLLKDARPSVDVGLIGSLAAALAAHCPGWSLEVLHHGTFRAGREAAARALLRELAPLERVRTVRTPRLSDAQLEAWITGLDLLALPYAHGTHSGLLELANDLGTRTLMPRVGYLGEQHRQANLTLASDGAADIVAALAAAERLAPLPRLEPAERRRRLRTFRSEHTAVYRRARASGAGRAVVGAPEGLSILLLSAFTHPIGQPHRGGLESHVWSLARELRRRGHRVSLAAPEGSDLLDSGVPAFAYPRAEWPADAQRTDARLPPALLPVEAAALARALGYAHAHPEAFDVIHDHSAHPLPLRTPGPVPLLTTLHTPPQPEMIAALCAGGRGRASASGESAPSELITVSRHTAAAWAARGVSADVVRNGVATGEWTLGPGGEGICWFGRIVPEKAPHLAVAAAVRAGARLTVVGPVGDEAYAQEVFGPAAAAAGSLVDVRGPLPVRELAGVVADSAAALVTPVWDEPFGQVVAEALACGTPVVAIARGGLGQTFSGVEGVHLVAPRANPRAQVADLAAALRPLLALRSDPAAAEQARSIARAQALERFSFDRTVDALERRYRRLAARAPRRGGARSDLAAGA